MQCGFQPTSALAKKRSLPAAECGFLCLFSSSTSAKDTHLESLIVSCLISASKGFPRQQLKAHTQSPPMICSLMTSPGPALSPALSGFWNLTVVQMSPSSVPTIPDKKGCFYLFPLHRIVVNNVLSYYSKSMILYSKPCHPHHTSAPVTTHTFMCKFTCKCWQ